ncbi:MAG: DUF4013 domain-containing protein [Methanobrevibacter sp.]|uniref:DUF4013 domain-containing protein n=1 Tax=Methanobrevibacter sp. TaxID=66852 RepID=UPI0025E6B2A7|nr:DUF4013 domain-containing protein [Methanobrevibacter sp.]MBR0271474.1 DUF4013 domain-containing protein [Methanobrevibacter sp.]
MILDIYKDSFEFASRKISNLLLLGVLSFFNFLLIPMVFFYGYSYRVVKLSTQSMINGEDVPPEFNDFKRMFIDGLKYIVVNLIYLIIPILVLFGGLVNGSWILLIIGIILFIIFALFAYAAIPHMAANDDSLKKAFAFGELNDIISSIGYGRYILNYIGVAIISSVILAVVIFVISFIFTILGIATINIAGGSGAVSTLASLIINIVLFFLVMPYLSIFQSRCSGLIYSLGS